MYVCPLWPGLAACLRFPPATTSGRQYSPHGNPLIRGNRGGHSGYKLQPSGSSPGSSPSGSVRVSRCTLGRVFFRDLTHRSHRPFSCEILNSNRMFTSFESCVGTRSTYNIIHSSLVSNSHRPGNAFLSTPLFFWLPRLTGQRRAIATFRLFQLPRLMGIKWCRTANQKLWPAGCSALGLMYVSGRRVFIGCWPREWRIILSDIVTARSDPSSDHCWKEHREVFVVENIPLVFYSNSNLSNDICELPSTAAW